MNQSAEPPGGIMRHSLDGVIRPLWVSVAACALLVALAEPDSYFPPDRPLSAEDVLERSVSYADVICVARIDSVVSTSGADQVARSNLLAHCLANLKGTV